MIEESIFAALKRRFKAYYQIAPQKQPTPYLVFSTISEVKSDVFCGQADTATVIQLDCYADDPLTAKAEAQHAFQTLGFLWPCNVNCGGSYEEETGLYRYQIEFTVIN